MNWIRIDTGIHNDARIGRMASACRVRVAEVVGCVVGVLSVMGSQAKDGRVGEVGDITLEKWAGWEGKAGVFAAAFRTELVTDGIVRSWDKHNGAALRELERTRERSRVWRDNKANGVRTGYERGTNGVANGVRTQTEQVDETRRNGTELTTPKDDGEVVSPPPSSSPSGLRAFNTISACVGVVGHEALRTLLSTVSEPDAWAGLIRGCASGLSMPEARPASAERLAAAVQDFVAAGHHHGQPAKVKLFRGYVGNAKASAAQTRYTPTLEDDRAEQLRLLREQNKRRHMRHEPLKPEPTWAAQIDATFPDGRTQPAGAAA